MIEEMESATGETKPDLAISYNISKETTFGVVLLKFSSEVANLHELCRVYHD